MKRIRSMLSSGLVILGMTAGAEVAVAEERMTAAQSLAGRYSRHFQNGLVSGEKYWSDDVVEIVPIAADAAYFRVSLQFYNGHTCDVSGVATADRDRLIYHEPSAPPGGATHCVLTLARAGANFEIADKQSCRAHCGARGMLDWRLPFNSKRPITYMARLQASREYQEALEAWRTGQAKGGMGQ